MYDTFLFDLDGTLVTMELDFAQIRKKVDAIVVSHRYPESLLDAQMSTLEAIRTAADYLRIHGMDWKSLKREADDYLEAVEVEAASKAIPIEGAKGVLKLLKKEKRKVGIITRNNSNVAWRVLEKSSFSLYVDTVLTRDDVENVKPHPDHILSALRELGSTAERTVVVGDHHYEIDAGNAAGCFTVGVLTGSGTKETLKDARMIVNSVKDLRKLV